MKKILRVVVLLAICGYVANAKEGYNATTGSEPKLFCTDYGNNVIGIKPFVFDAQIGVGLGISYERFLGLEQKFEVVVPLSLMFKNASPKDNYKHRQGTNRANYQRYVYFQPGLKMIASNPKSKVTYGLGPNLLLGWTGTKLDSLTQFNENGLVDHYYQHVQKKAIKLGLAVNNYIDIRLNSHLFIGATLGIGFWMYNHEKIISQKDEQVLLNEDYPAKATWQTSIGVGYRF